MILAQEPPSAPGTRPTGWFPSELNVYSRMDYMSFAKLSKLFDSPRTFEWYYIKNKPKKPETPAQRLGKLIDWALLNPKEFRRRAKVAPDVKRNTKEGKETYNAFLANLLPDAIIVESDEYEKISEMIQAIKEHPEAAKYLWPAGGMYGQCGYFIHPEFQIRGLAKPDVLIPHVGLIPELKTTNDARPHKFSSQIWELHYHMQSAWYKTAAEVLEFQLTGRATKYENVWVVMETTEPYHIEIYPPKKQLIEAGMHDIRTAVERYLQCSKVGKWYGYRQVTGEIDMPMYAYYHREENQ